MLWPIHLLTANCGKVIAHSFSHDERSVFVGDLPQRRVFIEVREELDLFLIEFPQSLRLEIRTSHHAVLGESPFARPIPCNAER
ncbi:MAG: hypothetical protein EA376_01760 [Phycisphaeraceae bacterium]|nr:MAG: hypothetical protein EA376_01760 [Phycisphaeraceae bacterium]